MKNQNQNREKKQITAYVMLIVCGIHQWGAIRSQKQEAFVTVEKTPGLKTSVAGQRKWNQGMLCLEFKESGNQSVTGNGQTKVTF